MVIYILERNEFVMTLLLFSIIIQLPFGSEILSSCIKFMVYTKATPVKKTSVMLFGIERETPAL